MNRSFHFIPAHRSEFIKNIKSLSADKFVLDLEDGVPEESRAKARENIRDLFSQSDPELLNKCFVRLNTDTDEILGEDLKPIRKFSFAGFVLPKVESASRLKALNSVLGADSQRKKIVLIESFSALNLMKDILEVEKLYAVGFGVEDFLVETSLMKDEAEELLAYARLQFVFSARSKNIIAIDAGFSLNADPEQLFEEASCSWKRGFHGMFTIHPSQINPVNRAYMPTESARAWADEVLKTAGSQIQTGYLREDGKLISPPYVKKAKRIQSYPKEGV